MKLKLSQHEFHVVWEWHYFVTFLHLEAATHAFSGWLLVQYYNIRHNFLLLSPDLLWNTYSMKQPDQYYFEVIKWHHRPGQNSGGNTRQQLTSSIQNLTRLMTSFLWPQNSIDQAVSYNKFNYNFKAWSIKGQAKLWGIWGAQNTWKYLCSDITFGRWKECFKN